MISPLLEPTLALEGTSAVAGLHVLRVCSVFEVGDRVLEGRGRRFDPIGGMQNHTAHLTRALDARGVEQVVVTTRPPGADAVERLGNAAAVHRFGLPVPWARQLYAAHAMPAMRRLSRDIDLVHVHLGEDLVVAPLAAAVARARHVPLVLTLHMSMRHTFPRDTLGRAGIGIAGAAAEAWACRTADEVIVLTPRLARLLPRPSHVIPSGVEPAEFAPDAPDPFPDVPRPRIVFVGRLARQKGVATLIDAAAAMRSGAQLVLVGDGPLRADVEERIDRHGLRDRVHLMGAWPHHRVPAALAHADVFVLPSVYEELGSALLEALQAGLPIVASRTGGIPDATGPAARLVPPGDPAALAAALDALATDGAERARLAALAAERAPRFHWSGLADRVAGVYEKALG